MKLTVAYYRLPDGRIIHRTEANADSDSWGVKPDVVVTLDDSEREAIRVSRHALDNLAQPDEAEGSKGSADEILRDRQLLAALRVASEGSTSD